MFANETYPAIALHCAAAVTGLNGGLGGGVSGSTACMADGRVDDFGERNICGDVDTERRWPGMLDGAVLMRAREPTGSSLAVEAGENGTTGY